MTMRVAGWLLATTGLILGAAFAFGREADPAAGPSLGQIHQLAASAELLVLSSDVHQVHQQITVVDPRKRVMSIYHVDRASGEVTLKSVRNIHWDLQMEEFNGTSPSPREIRSLLPRR